MRNVIFRRGAKQVGGLEDVRSARVTAALDRVAWARKLAKLGRLWPASRLEKRLPYQERR